MKPVDQTRFGPDRGNCFQACLASLLELPLDAVPDVMQGPKGPDGRWILRLNKWLKRYGWWALSIGKWDDAEECFGEALTLAGGLSPRSHGDEVTLHSVVWRGGECLFDPHPSRDGIKGPPKDYLVLLPLDPARHFSREPSTEDEG